MTTTDVSPVDVQHLRTTEFAAVGDLAYLNAASVGPIPLRTRQLLDELNGRREQIGSWGDEDVSLSRARMAVARLIGADQEEVALVPNTSFGMSVAAHCLPIEHGSTVLVSDREFPGLVYPWMGPASPGRLELLPTTPSGAPDEQRIVQRLARGDVSVVAVSAVQFSSGFRADLASLATACHEQGAFLVVDAMQAIGQVPLDVHELPVDILATGAWKWLCSPFGAGFLYVRRELLPRMTPSVVGFNAMAASGDVSRLTDYRFEFVEDARRFEAGTHALQDLAAMASSIELLLEVGIDRISEHVTRLLEPFETWLAQHPEVEIVSDRSSERRSAIFCFRPPRHEAALGALEAGGVRGALREGSIRISPHLYNTPADIDRLMEVLEGHLAC